MRLNAFILRKKGMVESPRGLSEHLKNRRLSLALTQEEVAVQLGTMREVYERWERGERQPVVSEWPGIVKFLGSYPSLTDFDPFSIRKARRVLGLTQKQLGRRIGAIHQDVRKWEKGIQPPTASIEGKLTHLFLEAR